MQHLQEWQSVQFTGGTGKLALLMISALPAAVLFSRRRWRPDQLLLMAFALWASLSHVRFLFFAGLIAVPMFAPYFKLFPPYDRELDKPWLNAGIMAAIVGALFFFFHRGGTATTGQRKLSHRRTGLHAAASPRRKNLQRLWMGRLPGVERSRVKAIYRRPRGHIYLQRNLRRPPSRYFDSEFA